LKYFYFLDKSIFCESICFNYVVHAPDDDYTLSGLESELQTPDDKLPRDSGSKDLDVETSFTSAAGNELFTGTEWVFHRIRLCCLE
jgi:hypothetical protein